MKKAGLRGRGGAGFPTGTKWDKVLNHRVKEHYFVCNAGEHEPGTFKDRHLTQACSASIDRRLPHCGRTVQAKAAFIYVNHEYEEERENLRKAMAQAQGARVIGEEYFGEWRGPRAASICRPWQLCGR